MRIIAAPSDHSGCGEVRIAQPANAVMALDPSVIVEPLQKHHFTIGKSGNLVSLSLELLSADVLIIQRPCVPLQTQILRAAKQAGVATVVEIDDDLHRMHKDHPLRQNLKPVHYASLKACCQEADLVTCSTETLSKRYAQHGRVQVIHNYVPRAYTEISRPLAADFLVVGWSGSLSSHPTDLKATRGGVGAALRHSEAIFRVIGHPTRVAEDLGLESVTSAPWCKFEDYPHELAKFDIGICPLDSITFNRSKSWLKPLEMASVGVPVVMSPVGEYAKLPFGLFASTPGAWETAIKQLLRDHEYRHHIAEQGRQAVREHFLLEDHAHEWLEAWETAVANRKRCYV